MPVKSTMAYDLSWCWGWNVANVHLAHAGFMRALVRLQKIENGTFVSF